MNHSLQEILSRDPVDEFIRSPVANSGLFVHAMSVNQLKNDALQKCDDTTFSNKLDRYQRIIGEVGFRKVLEIPFRSHNGTDTFFVYWRDGILLSFDTYGDLVNGGTFSYNWKKGKNGHNPLSSGGWYIRDESGKPTYDEQFGDLKDTPEALVKIAAYNEKWNREKVWAGNHDCREAIRHRIAALEEFGTILPKWEFRPFLWLLHHGDTKIKDYDYAKINAERTAMLPDDVRAAITADNPVVT